MNIQLAQMGLPHNLYIISYQLQSKVISQQLIEAHMNG